jgi:hypothetical protein
VVQQYYTISDQSCNLCVGSCKDAQPSTYDKRITGR